VCERARVFVCVSVCSLCARVCSVCECVGVRGYPVSVII